jgi:DNA-directed RNA polymerase specialized sigma24 family protein
VLDVPLGTVKSRLSDARRRLKVELAGYVNA